MKIGHIFDNRINLLIYNLTIISESYILFLINDFKDFKNIYNVESKLKNLSLPNALFASEIALSFFRNIDFRVLLRIMH